MDNLTEIYGISYKPGDKFSANFYRFADRSQAERFLNKEEYDFREREICSFDALVNDYAYYNTDDSEAWENVLNDIIMDYEEK